MLSMLRRLSTESPSLFEEIWQFLSDKYFSVNFEDYAYENIHMTTNTFFSAQSIIIALFLGVIVAAAMSLYQKRTLGNLVRALDREGCYDADRAKTLEELGLLRSAAIKQALRGGSSLQNMVCCVGKDEYTAAQIEKRTAFEHEQSTDEHKPTRKKWREIPYRYDFASDRFYLPENKAFDAVTLFNKKGTNPLIFAFTVVVCIALMVLCCFLLPEMVQLADNFVGVFRNT